MNHLWRLLTNENRSFIFLVGGTLLVLSLLAWSIGWASHALIERGRYDTTPTPVRPMVLPTPLPARPEIPPLEPTIPLEKTPTSTLKPTSYSTPISQTGTTVQPGEGLYQVCRRYCAGRWPPDDASLQTYAKEVTRLNQLPWPNPIISPGQSLEMPPCP